MARARRAVSALITDIRRKLNEPDSSDSFWTDGDLLAYLQEAKDLRELQLIGHHEGWQTQEFKYDIVAEQSSYKIPEEATLVKRVFYQRNGYRAPLVEDRQHYGSFDDNVQLDPRSYRILDDHIILYPTPGQAITDGLIVDVDVSDDRLQISSKLPDSWPPQTESLLIYDTAISALEMQGVDADLENSSFGALKLNQQRLERAWNEAIQKRSFGIVVGPSFDWGA